MADTTMKTLGQAIFAATEIDSRLSRAIGGLIGCPEGETVQARQAIVEAAPIRSERDWTVTQLIEATLKVRHGRFVWRGR